MATTAKAKKNNSKSLKHQVFDHAIDTSAPTKKMPQHLTGSSREPLSDWEHAS